MYIILPIKNSFDKNKLRDSSGWCSYLRKRLDLLKVVSCTRGFIGAKGESRRNELPFGLVTLNFESFTVRSSMISHHAGSNDKTQEIARKKIASVPLLIWALCEIFISQFVPIEPLWILHLLLSSLSLSFTLPHFLCDSSDWSLQSFMLYIHCTTTRIVNQRFSPYLNRRLTRPWPLTWVQKGKNVASELLHIR